tara:strand:+ start:3336 stop:3782 length:447 start_codon:yes stop_codon:yes gene_type:complete
MIKKYIFSFIILLVLSGCGYKPIYSTKDLNFSIGNIERDNSLLNNKFIKVINSLKNEGSDNKINIKISSDKEVNIKSKDKKGNALIFELKIILNVVNLENDNQTQKFERNINYKNLTDKFKLKQYENELEKILINKLVEDLITYLASI